jgi:hypothetical protein
MKIDAKQLNDAIRLYGETKINGIWGEKKFAAHDARKTWADNGEPEEIADRVRSAIAENVRDAMIENVKDGSFELAAYRGELYAVFDMSNGPDVPLKANVKLSELLLRAVTDAHESGEDGQSFKRALCDALIQITDGIRRTLNMPPEPIEASMPARRRRPATAANDMVEPDLTAAMTGYRSR